MGSAKPYFSIVVPTRNRPDLVTYPLTSLREQTFTDFEVILCDNHTGQPCKHVFDRHADERFRYVVPETPLNMQDNWDFACSHARGEYVAVLMDKTVFRPRSLEIAAETLGKMPADLISWWDEAYRLTNESSSYGMGTYTPLHQARPAAYFDAHQELIRRYKVDVRRGWEGNHYYLGKINFGAYRRTLLERIRKRLGRVFFPIAPDYTSMLAALALCESSVDLGQPLRMAIHSVVGNGFMSRKPENFIKFLRSADPTGELLASLPLPGIFVAVHNTVACDYVTMKQRLSEEMADVELDKANLAIRVREDLETQVCWPDDALRRQQYRFWESAVNKLPLEGRMRVRLQQIRRLYNAYRTNVVEEVKGLKRDCVVGIRDAMPDRMRDFIKEKLRKPGTAPTNNVPTYECQSVNEAARLADAYYEKQLASTSPVRTAA